MKIITGLHAYGFNPTEQTVNILIDDDDNGDIITNNDIPFEATIFDSNNQYAILPGWFDSHIHGNSGYDFADQDLTLAALEKITHSLGQAGVAYCMPTLVSLSLERIKNNLHILDIFIDKQEREGAKPGSAKLIGVHLEGPFIAHNCKGAHDENVLQKRITCDMFIDLVKAAPHINVWKITLAPELEGAIQFIRDTRKLNVDGRSISVNVFIGHTNADTLYIEQAFNEGAVGFTHLGNANCETAHRSSDEVTHAHLKSNVVKYALDEKNKASSACFELITDGYHLSKEFVNFAITGRENNAILITDALGPTGLADGSYSLGSLPIQKKGEVFYLENSDKLAGSAANLATLVKKFSTMIEKEGPALWDILYHATVVNPRKTALSEHVNLNDKKNFVVIDRTGKLVLSVCNGKTYHHTNAFTKTIASTQGYFVTKNRQHKKNQLLATENECVVANKF